MNTKQRLSVSFPQLNFRIHVLKKNWPAFDDLNSLQYTVLKLHLYLLIASVFDGFIQTGH